jgi:hypothetical protein
MASITTPVTVVNQPYDTSGNGGRKLVRLSNGWLVAAMKNGFNTIELYVSKDNGSTWSRLCYSGNTDAQSFTLASRDNFVYLLWANNVSTFAVYFNKIDVPSISAPVDISTSKISIESGPQSAFSGLSLAIAPDGTLHAAWASKNSTYPNSFNIRYAKGTIDGSGNVTWGSVTQISTHNASTANHVNPCVIVLPNGNPVIIHEYQNSSDYRILVSRWNGSTWEGATGTTTSATGTTVYSGGSYAQSSPCPVVDNAGVIHVVWHGKDATHTSVNNVRYSKSTDEGTTWSPMLKITTGGTTERKNASIAVNSSNKLFVHFESGADIAQVSSTDGGASWSASILMHTGANSPSLLADKSLNFSSPLRIFKDSTSVKFSGSWNEAPTLTLTSPTDNQTLNEGNVFSIQGSAGDTDNGNVVTVKFKINGGTARAIASGVSDGSSPISFVKNLTYSNKRLWDGNTDVAGVDLAEGVDHTLTVWAEDDQGGKSAEITRNFRVIWNRPPTISGTDTDLGVISVAPSQTYTVSDPEGQSFTITEYLDGEVLRTFSGVAGQEYTVTIPADKWLRTSLAQHTLKVRATDSAGQFSERTYTFTRTDDRIVFELDEPFLTDAKANRILVTLDAVIPPGASYIVEACNNAFDAQPTWEDVTGPVSAGRGYIFTNETKAAANWGVSIRFTFLKGTATEKILINGFGGAFD